MSCPSGSRNDQSLRSHSPETVVLESRTPTLKLMPSRYFCYTHTEATLEANRTAQMDSIQLIQDVPLPYFTYRELKKNKF